MKNIVYIFCDELRQDALGCYGNPAGKMMTPNIDSIAERGTLFENCFCNSPVCVPSRTSIMTGLYPEDTGVYHNEAALKTFSMPVHPVTFPQVLRDAGYRTASFGKTHLARGMNPFETDVETGSEMTLGLSRDDLAGLEKVAPRRVGMNVASLYPEEKEYKPEQVTENALNWIAGTEEPFFVRISYLQPHTPVIVKRGYERLYEDYGFSTKAADLSGLSEFERTFGELFGEGSLTQEELHKALVYYYGMVSWIDDEVGKVLKFLTETGREDTIVIFNADHGAVRGECGAMAGKHIFNRASQAVPLIISDPDRAGGERVSALCSNIDLPKTLFGLLGIDLPEQFKGVDLFSGSYPEAVYSTIGYGEEHSYAFPNRRSGRMQDGRGWPRRACVRMGHYRLDMNTRRDGHPCTPDEEDIFFVDTDRCPTEDKNMKDLSEYSEVIDRMTAMLRAHCENSVEVDGESVRIPDNFNAAKYFNIT